MDTEAALAFLAQHQPLPDDAALHESTARNFEAARAHFATTVDARCVPLLLHSFGRGTGFGTYQLVEDALAMQDPVVVATALPMLSAVELAG